MNIYVCMGIYIYIYIFVCVSLSMFPCVSISMCMNIYHHDVTLLAWISLTPLSPLVSIVHRSWKVLPATSCTGT